MHIQPKTHAIRRDWSIHTDIADRRLTLRLDPDSNKCLEMGFALAIQSGRYAFRDKSSFLRYLVHAFYREIGQEGRPPASIEPVHFGQPHGF